MPATGGGNPEVLDLLDLPSPPGAAPLALPFASVDGAGEAVEVQQWEDGLRGVWFQASLLQTRDDLAQVEYHCGGGGAGAQPVRGWAPASCIRPLRLDAHSPWRQDAAGVEVGMLGGFWPGEVVVEAEAPPGSLVVRLAGSGELVVAKQEHMRAAWVRDPIAAEEGAKAAAEAAEAADAVDQDAEAPPSPASAPPEAAPEAAAQPGGADGGGGFARPAGGALDDPAPAIADEVDLFEAALALPMPLAPPPPRPLPRALAGPVPDCGRCLECLDKPKFGGPGRRKKMCLVRAEAAKLAAEAGDGDLPAPAPSTGRKATQRPAAAPGSAPLERARPAPIGAVGLPPWAQPGCEVEAHGTTDEDAGSYLCGEVIEALAEPPDEGVAPAVPADGGACTPWLRLQCIMQVPPGPYAPNGRCASGTLRIASPCPETAPPSPTSPLPVSHPPSPLPPAHTSAHPTGSSSNAACPSRQCGPAPHRPPTASSARRPPPARRCSSVRTGCGGKWSSRRRCCRSRHPKTTACRRGSRPGSCRGRTPRWARATLPHTREACKARVVHSTPLHTSPPLTRPSPPRWCPAAAMVSDREPTRRRQPGTAARHLRPRVGRA